MMQRTTKPVYDALCQYMRNRSDIGVFKAMLNGVLEARHPFDRKAARPPKRWFVLFSLLAALALGCFIYFGNVR
jgi:hypothetical protein